MVDKDLINAVITTWESQIRANEKKILPISYFQGTKEQSNDVACALFRYIFEKVLGWSKTDAVNYLTFEHIKSLNLIRAFNALDYPPVYKDRRCATFYVAILCYPELKKYYNEQTLWTMEYNRCLDRGRNNYIKIDTEKYEYSRNKSCVLLNYVLRNDSTFENLEELYTKFASKKIRYYLESKRLYSATKLFLSPLDYLHNSLPNDVDKLHGRNDFLLKYIEFKQLNGEIE